MLSNLNLVSLHGFNNLKKLRYDINGSQLPQLLKQLQTVSSPLISNVNLTYYHEIDDDNYRHWNDIDHLMIQTFPALLTVTMTWSPISGKVTWDQCVSQCTAALPQLHQEGILCQLLPPEDQLK